jgi:hypothetical protein
MCFYLAWPTQLRSTKTAESFRLEEITPPGIKKLVGWFPHSIHRILIWLKRVIIIKPNDSNDDSKYSKLLLLLWKWKSKSKEESEEMEKSELNVESGRKYWKNTLQVLVPPTVLFEFSWQFGTEDIIHTTERELNQKMSKCNEVEIQNILKITNIYVSYKKCNSIVTCYVSSFRCVHTHCKAYSPSIIWLMYYFHMHEEKYGIR